MISAIATITIFAALAALALKYGTDETRSGHNLHHR